MERLVDRLIQMERLKKLETNSFYMDHVCDSKVLEFPCPCRICKWMINSYEGFCTFRPIYGTCDRQDDIDDGKCSFIIHKKCTESKNTPRHIPHHPFHPQHDDLALSSGHHLSSDQAICNACGDDLKTCFVYKCSTPHCSFALDVKCAFLTLTNISNQGGDLHLPLHPHPLILCNKGKSWIGFAEEYFSNLSKVPKKEEEHFSYSCTCCKLPFNDVDTLLVCLECKALLHKSCADIPWNIEKHPFHPSHPLVLLPRVPNPGPCFKCHLCRQKKQDGFAYHCPECGIFLDVRCASLKPKTNNADDKDDVQELKHFHTLIVCDDEKNAFPRTCYSCGACGHPFGDGDKMYFCHECECLLDQSCADHSEQDIEHVLHPEHKLTFWYRPLLNGHRECRACLSSIGDSGYQCFECKFYLDIKCSSSKYTVLTSPLHRNPLFLHTEADRKQRCNVCNERCNTSFYCSLVRDFVIHAECMKTFPTKFQSVLHHPHALTLWVPEQSYRLTRSLAKKELFICRVCHKKEYAGPLYICEEYWDYKAHPHCVVSGGSEIYNFKCLCSLYIFA